MGIGGAADSEYEHSVFMAANGPSHVADDPDYDGTPRGHTFTVFSAIRNRRCLLTADHSIDGEKITRNQGQPWVVYQGQNLYGKNLNSAPRQAVAAGLGRWHDLSGAKINGSRPDGAWGSYSDVAILWLEDRTGVDNLKKYKKLEIDSSEFMKANDLSYIDTSDARDDRQAVFVGYGNRGKNANPPKAFREQILTTVHSYSRPPVNSGSNTVDPGAGYWTMQTNTASCKGDSGGPLILDGKVIGTLAGGVNANGDCIVGGDPSVFAALTRYEYPINSGDFYHSNYGWIMKNVDFVCTKYLMVLISPDPRNVGGLVMGKVVGSLRRDRTVTTDIEHNASIDTAKKDHVESITEEMTSNRITAIPSPGYRFVSWQGGVLRDADTGKTYNTCPCNGSTTTDCVLSYDDVGYYSDSTSSDRSGCIARFAQVSVPIPTSPKSVPPE
jgi:hypothetical protein